jgi:hypothetical protein
MNFLSRPIAGAIVAGALIIPGQSMAQLLDQDFGTIGSFSSGTALVADIFTVTYIDSTAGLNPTGPVAGGSPAAGDFPTIAATNLPTDYDIDVTVVQIGDTKVADFVVSTPGISSETPTLFNLSYTIEIYEPDPTERDDVRLDFVSIGANINDQFDNASAQKWIFGQDTVVVPDATFKAVVVDPGTPGTVQCGVCRKFVVTDIFNTQADGISGSDRGVLSSVSNTYTVVVPVPAPLALFGAGLVGLGFMRKFRK